MEEAQDALCPGFVTFEPQAAEVRRAEKLYQLFRTAYFALGTPGAEAVEMGGILPALRIIRHEALAGR